MALLTDPPVLSRARLAAWIDRPLARLPRPAAILTLLALIAGCIWSISATGALIHSADARIEAQQEGQHPGAEGDRGDLSLYRAINARMARGQGYYEAAIAEQMARNYPTKPFFTVRSPVLAEGTRLFGSGGWRIVATFSLGLCLVGLMGLPSERTSAPERIGAALLVALCGLGAFLDIAGLVHELIAGLLLSAALLLYRPRRWWPSLVLAAAALAVRELALPFLLLWMAFAIAGRRKGEALALLGVIALFAIGMALHAQAVIALGPPDAPSSQGWSGLLGPQAFLEAMVRLTPLSFLPLWLGTPLALLPLFGWLGLGGRPGLFAALWFAGFALAIALFARPENFYWGAMVLPAYGAGLAFVPRAVADLLAAARGVPPRERA
ncbi:hypothetical protein H0274_10890 [Altererythrobacter sp. CC-YST694]|uniref:hypothetical protein n=1 Tax=Altererythrobacter sp. CC-YST694 TaxID=2755038 RepID=UPI001D002372|nr:hypothetical protein [Altererythrobacter sp. CC-YST694]MCB5425767.1 hypothetical protein [Altererythrobacter sp. CC-YST694]